jgi:hypothetical protein
MFVILVCQTFKWFINKTYIIFLSHAITLQWGKGKVVLLFWTAENTGGNVGLAITQAIGLTGMLQWGMRQSTELENQMTSVERVLEFTHLEQEPPLTSPPGKIINIFFHICYFVAFFIVTNHCMAQVSLPLLCEQVLCPATMLCNTLRYKISILHSNLSI